MKNNVFPLTSAHNNSNNPYTTADYSQGGGIEGPPERMRERYSDGGGGNNIVVRLAVVEEKINNIEKRLDSVDGKIDTTFRWCIGAIAGASALGLACLWALYSEISKQNTKLSEQNSEFYKELSKQQRHIENNIRQDMKHLITLLSERNKEK